MNLTDALNNQSSVVTAGRIVGALHNLIVLPEFLYENECKELAEYISQSRRTEYGVDRGGWQDLQDEDDRAACQLYDVFESYLIALSTEGRGKL